MKNAFNIQKETGSYFLTVSKEGVKVVKVDADHINECTVIYKTDTFDYKEEVVGHTTIKDAGVCLWDGPFATTKTVEQKEVTIKAKGLYFHSKADGTRVLKLN